VFLKEHTDIRDKIEYELRKLLGLAPVSPEDTAKHVPEAAKHAAEAAKPAAMAAAAASKGRPTR
jgi:hypothetical protein